MTTVLKFALKMPPSKSSSVEKVGQEDLLHYRTPTTYNEHLRISPLQQYLTHYTKQRQTNVSHPIRVLWFLETL